MKNVSFACNKPPDEEIARSDLLHSILSRYGILLLPGTMQTRATENAHSVEFIVVPSRDEKDYSYRALLKKRCIIEVEKLSIAIACLPSTESEMSDSDKFHESSDEPSQHHNMLEMVVCNAIDQLLDHLVCERGFTFGRWLNELCVSEILIPSIAGDLNAGLEMLLSSPNENSGSCSQLIVQSILTTLGESKVQTLASEGQSLVKEGVQVLLNKFLERSKRQHQRSHDKKRGGLEEESLHF
jgi:hypothetical protein